MFARLFQRRPPLTSDAALTEKVGLIFAGTPRALLLSLFGVCVMAQAFIRPDNHDAVVSWLLAAGIILLLRTFLWYSWRRDHTRDEHIARWRARLVAGSFIGGAMWGLAAILLFPDTDLPRQTLLALLMCGAGASAAVMMAPDRLAGYAFLLPCLLPAIAQFQLHFMHAGYSVAMMGLLYSAVIVDGMRRFGRYIDDNIGLRLALVERERGRQQFERELDESQKKLQEDIKARKAIEKQMAEDRAKLEAFVQHTPASVVMLDNELNFVACTARWARTMNADPELLAGGRFYDVYPEMSRRYRDVHQRSLAGSVERCEEELYVGRKGSYWLRWEVRPWYKHADVIGGIMILTEDITARKEVEIALRERDALLQKITERVPGVIMQFRSFPNGGSEIQYCTDAVRKIFELEVEDVYADYTTLGARILPEDRPGVAATIADATRTLIPWKMDYRVQLPVRGVRWLHTEALGEPQPDGAVIWHSYVTDITDLKKIEEQLKALNHRFELAVHAARIGVWEWNILTDKLVWDKRMYEIYDFPAGEILDASAPVNDRVHPDDWERIRQSFIEVLEDPEIARYEIEYRLVWPDDSEHVVRTAAFLQRDVMGRAESATGVTWDITESKKIERMKSEFVSMVSHELRTPLTSIRGSLALLERGVGGALTADAKELINVAYKNSERLSLLINDILDIEKIESDKIRFNMQRHTLRSLLEQAVTANRGYAQTYDVELALLEPIGDADVLVDSDRFEQVLANLISNAVKFSAPRDTVEVAALLKSDAVRIEVRDRGPGISEEFRERIFQRFSQADTSDTRAKGGSGLGLSITKSIVEKMQGQIGFESRDGRGTVFFFELPRAL